MAQPLLHNNSNRRLGYGTGGIPYPGPIDSIEIDSMIKIEDGFETPTFPMPFDGHLTSVPLHKNGPAAWCFFGHHALWGPIVRSVPRHAMTL